MFAFPLLIGLIIGAVMGKVCEGIVTVIPFMFLRKFSGGYHAKYWRLCIVISSTVLGTALYIQDYVEMNSRLTACVLISAILLILFSPVESSNRKLDNDERIWFRKMVLAIETVAFIIYLLLICNNFSQTAIAFGIGMIIPLIMQIPCYITKITHFLLMIRNLKKP